MTGGEGQHTLKKLNGAALGPSGPRLVTSAIGRGARHHDRHRNDRGRAIGERVNHAEGEIGMPGLRDEAHERDRGAAERDAPAHQQPQRRVVGELAGEKSGDGGDDPENPCGDADFAASPGEFFDHRLQRQSDGEAAAPDDEEDEKARQNGERGL